MTLKQLCISLAVVLLASGCQGARAPFADQSAAEASAGEGRLDASAETVFIGCGDKQITTGEVCDDGNAQAGDGCAADCRMIEPGWICVVPGDPCMRVAECGNGRLEDDEVCDDGNTSSGDGCDNCSLEQGWTCTVAGLPCVAAKCGDGIKVGSEECDDGGLDAPGCDDACRIESGYKCPQPNTACEPTVCGDGKKEGSTLR